MLQIKRALGLVFLLNLACLGVMYFYYRNQKDPRTLNVNTDIFAETQLHEIQEKEPVETFKDFTDDLDIRISLTDDPNDVPKKPLPRITANNVLRTFGAYKAPPLEYYNDYPNAKPHFKTPYMGIIHNPDYCDTVDKYNLKHPENVLENMRFVGDYIPISLVRTTIFPELGEDVMPQCNMGMTKGSHDLNTTATAFFTKSVLMHHYYEIGTHFACASQIYGHIPGSGVLTRKDMVVGTANDYAKRYESKPQCFNKQTYFPYAYRLYNKTECLQFFDEINSAEYKKLRETEPFVFLLKAGWGAHRAMGIEMLYQDEEDKLRKDYGEGQLCGKVNQSSVIQKYIANPLLLDLNNKFDFRMYMLIASVDPLIVFYHDGFLRVSLGTYDKNSQDRGVHLTNTHLSKEKFEEAGNGTLIHGMNETELRDYQMWTMEDLQDHLFEIGKIKNKNWLDEHLRPQFKEAFIHTVRMAESNFFKMSNAYEMFGLDFLLDENLNLWFIECNASPQLIGTNDYKTEFLTKMLKDLFEIQYAYLRSRWQRILAFVERFNKARKENGGRITVSKWKNELESINRNRLEPGYTISEDNSWHLIMDKNRPGKDAYLGFFKEECIDD